MRENIQDLQLYSLMKNLYKTGEYYVSIPAQTNSFEENYWGTIIDPDGKVRDRSTEKNSFLEDIDYIINYINNLSGGNILDIGCGRGWLISALNQKWNKFGLEISKYAAEEAKEYGSIFCGNLEDAQYENGVFDLLVSHHVIEHIEDPKEMINEMIRILKPGGHLIIATPDFDSGCARLFGKHYRLLQDPTHISLFSNDSMHRFLRDYGLTINEVCYPFFQTRFHNIQNYERMLNYNEHKISPAFYGNFMTFFCTKE